MKNNKLFFVIGIVFIFLLAITIVLFKYEGFLVEKGKDIMSTDEKIRLYEKNKRLENDIDNMIELARLYAINKQYNDAKNLLIKVLDKQPKNVLILHRLALIYEELEDYDRAIELRKRIIEIEPDVSANHGFYGNLLLTKDINLSIEEINKSVEYSKEKKDEASLKYYSDYLEFLLKSKENINKNGYMGYIDIVNSDYLINSNGIKLGIINKIYRDYPNISEKDKKILEDLKFKILTEKTQ